MVNSTVHQQTHKHIKFVTKEMAFSQIIYFVAALDISDLSSRIRDCNTLRYDCLLEVKFFV